MKLKHHVVVCGAGIAGVSAAYHLAQAGVHDILLVDPLPPLTLTSDHSTECYRNWWPDPDLAALMNRSIDIMERLALESGNAIRMNRRGYVYVSADEAGATHLSHSAERIARDNAWSLRVHDSVGGSYAPGPGDGFMQHPEGADLLLGNALVRTHFPYLSESVFAALHVRRAGWLSAQQLGMLLLERARASGVIFRSGRITAARISGTHIRNVVLETEEEIECEALVLAAGPYLKEVGRLCGLDLPVQAELHLKLAFEDTRGVLARDAPLLIWNDPLLLPWAPDELDALSSDPALRWLTAAMPGGAHTRPEGGEDSRSILMLWDYRSRAMEPLFPHPLDEQYPEIVLRGLSIMLPGLRTYFGRAGRPRVDGGYYMKTPENRLLAGPTQIAGVYVLGALSGYGIMSACAAGELLAAHVAGLPLPAYASAFSLARYGVPGYLESVAGLAGGEL